MSTYPQTVFVGEKFGELDISSDVEREGRHSHAIGEHSDLWKGRLTNGTSDVALLVAIKVLRGGSTSDPKFVDKLTTRLVTYGSKWKTFDHENVIHFYGIALNCGYMPALVLPFYSKGNIANYVKTQDAETKFKLVKEIAAGIEYLHSLSVVHGDIRGANVLINDDGHAVLADYSLVFIIESTDFTSAKTAGTCRWMAPEVMNPSEDIMEDLDLASLFTTYSDIYAFAMTVFEIFSGDVPFSNKKTDSAVIFYVLAENRPDFAAYTNTTNNSLRTLVKRCWVTDPSERPSAKSVVEELDKIPSIQEANVGWIRRVLDFFWSAFG